MTAPAQDFAKPDASWKEVQGSLPRAGRVVKYRTSCYQMLGYLDRTGHWVAMDGTEELQPVRSWREIFEPASTWPERLG